MGQRSLPTGWQNLNAQSLHSLRASVQGRLPFRRRFFVALLIALIGLTGFMAIVLLSLLTP